MRKILISRSLPCSVKSTKRELIRTLVKRVEIGKEEVKVIFRIMPDPFESSPNREILQHCSRRLCLQAATATVMERFFREAIRNSRSSPQLATGRIHFLSDNLFYL